MRFCKCRKHRSDNAPSAIHPLRERVGNDNSGSPVYGRLGHGSTEPFSATPVPVSGLNLN